MTAGFLRRLPGAMANLFRREILRDPFLLEAKRWFHDRGDKTLRLNYPLGPESVVLDLGGFQGDFAADIHGRYGCQVFIFEPMPDFHAACVQRFAGNSAIHCLQYGLAANSGTLEISDAGDASSFVRAKGSAPSLQASVRAVADAWLDLGLGNVDLMKINIEGGEYDVLPALLDSGLIRNVRFLQVQFHNFIEGAPLYRETIRRRLLETHDEMWNYDFVWESWSRR